MPTALEGWRPELELNIAEIDKQHRKLIECAVHLNAAVREGCTVEQVRQLLSALIAVAEDHFASEEAMMLSQAFDGHPAHRDEHKRLLEQVHMVDRDLSSGTIELSNVVTVFITAWIEQHISQFDRPFAEFLKSRGVA